MTGTTVPPPLPQEPTATPVGWSDASAAVERGRCPACGGSLAFDAAVGALRCGSCRATLDVTHGADERVDEHDYERWRARHPQYAVASVPGQPLACEGCGATTQTTDIAGACRFCGGNLVATTLPEGVIVPEAVLPFGVDSRTARENVTTWVRSRWFAPSALKKVGDTESIRGTYVPHWTFDARTTSDYVGQRGDHYTEKQGDQEVRRTRWRHAAGRVRRDFDDLLVPASRALPRNRLDKLGPWTLKAAQPYRHEYLVGHSAPRYDVDPQDAHAQAKQRMDAQIRDDVEHDIGGDEQRVHSISTTYADVMFKLVLLPVWLATFMYAGKQWQVMVNANTGEVVGERPWSVPKIVAAVLVGILLVVLAVWFFGRNQQ
ncbi:hypothetical protein [Cellulomonas uda]|uniref:TFIIB-type domain-containing protein n=1 Tax=Cellulomonas uda TaxID=1714 RepID=A0A4Y3KDA0_CELUD|nr:hypothetical protein [Cellulomonas uda]NII66259.1 hypothetical protein [Cellulomonas uda]GEA81932.1 hypothetical protein CUD01_23760 [Cellulomonas uda]